ncbi:hypothetical protein H6F88_04690 [Oculatella sp. FACHB-28]|uniref:NACHT and WD repeat domain-containing protein n=1 Tax=Oculatella sp. FACHB-28 TaxID=2692845 RepID=UPI0019BD0EA4|nr:hypothetical protein [Oculatella sp. FACHB-28]
MQESPEPRQKPLKGLIDVLKEYQNLIQGVGGVAGTILSFSQQAKDHPLYLAIGILLVIASIAWYFISRRHNYHSRQKVKFEPPIPGSKAYLRGLLPFERGEHLLGREGDVKRIFAKVTAFEFTFGYLSGDAGSGKTSLLRAGLIPEVEKLGWLIVYVPRTSGNPKEASLKALRRISTSSSASNSDIPLQDILSVVLQEHQIERLMMIYDQFEEFFIVNRTKSAREEFAKEIGDCLDNENLSVSFLFSLRKEFVDDLRDFAPWVSQPLDIRFSDRLRNWEPAIALETLQIAASNDKVLFSEALMVEVVRDLTQDSEVRPVELQLVATCLRDQYIYELGRYHIVGGAYGILAEYIKETIEPLGERTPELERQIARHLLRSLCAVNRDARRPQGLQFEELIQHIQTAMQSKGQAALLRNDQAFYTALQQVLEQCMNGYLIVLEDEQTYNLVHDYIVTPIREATADIETVEEQANRLLDRYLEEQRQNPHTIVPVRGFRFLIKYASPHRLSQDTARQLINRTKRQYVIRSIAIVMGLVLLITLLLPPQIRFDVKTYKLGSEWLISQDRQLAISFDDEENELLVWQLNLPWSSHEEFQLPFDFEDVVISPKANFLAGITGEGNVYIWKPEQKLTQASQPILTGLSKSVQEEEGNDWDNTWGGFSPDEQWVYVSSNNGEVYVWHPSRSSGSNLKPFLSLKTNKLDCPFDCRPVVQFSPKGRWIAIQGDEENEGTKLYILKPDQSFSETLSSILKTASAFSENNVFFTENDEWIATVGEDGGVYVWKISQPPQNLLPAFIEHYDDEDVYPYYDYNIAFSPNSEWIVVRPTFRDFYAWKVTEPPGDKAQPVIDLASSSSDLFEVSFSKDGKWVAGTAQDGKLYVWQLDSPSSENIKPVFEKNANRAVFSPDSDYIAAQSADGNIYVWKVGEKPNLDKPAAYHNIGDFSLTNIKFTSDNSSIFTFEGSEIYWGKVGEKLIDIDGQQLTYSIRDLVTDKRNLIVFGHENFSIIQRRFYLWGVPLRTYSWLALADS